VIAVVRLRASFAYEGTFRFGYAKRVAMPYSYEASRYETSGN
jgi:hypothetical protein